MKGTLLLAAGLLAACGEVLAAGAACPENISPDVDPALCDPSSFERAPDEFITEIDAGFGLMKVRTVRAWAPRCADRFYNLVKHGFFDNQRFYRVTPAYIQFGYHADRVVNENIYHWNCTANDGACFVTDPWQPSVKNNTQGTIAFGAVYESVDKFCADINPDANVCQAGYETNGGSLVVTTELFISRVDNSPLGEYGFVPFAEIIEGFELTNNVYDQYGEVHGGSVGETMCGANEICKGPNPDRIMEGNSYFDKDFPDMTPLTKASLATSTSGCPANISPDVDPALCDPASFERAPDEFVTEIDAGFGKMKVRTVRAWAPRCADRFYNLVKHGFFDNQRFYRVTPAYIQFGYHADRVVNENIYHWNCTANDGACFVTDPWQPSVKNNTEGTIAFGAVYESVDKFCADINPDANVCQAGYETNGGSLVVTTELFISRVDNSPLGEYGFVPFAEIIEGFELTNNVYDQYGEVHGGSVGETMCGANEICKGPNPDRIMEGNSYFDKDFPNMTHLTTAALVPAASGSPETATAAAPQPQPTALPANTSPTEVAVAATANEDSGGKGGLYIAIAAVAIIIILVIVGGVVYFRRKRRSEQLLMNESTMSME